ncbi:MAG: DegT/DnrJ/EryC1/StrS family aminotransferase [Pirellulales bacterium]|nr:DegT/DnrJ/EryC1/StrS family aminotransferase [Pirellulales bacterium]
MASETSEISVPLLDLKAQYAPIREETIEAVRAVLDSQWFILGPTVKECEARIAEYCHCPHAVGVASGTDALLVSLMAEGIGAGDEVITTPYTFFATAGSIARLNAKPVFVDVLPSTFNLDPSQIEDRITENTKAIIPVHLFGQCAEMDPILEIAERHGLTVIEDAAQAIGAEYKGRRAGSIGQYGCFSFFPSKNLGGGGDGGMVVTDDAQRAERLDQLRVHGQSSTYYHANVGGNFRFDAIQAAIINVKLPYLDGWTAARQSNAERYRRLFEGSGLTANGLVRLPQVAPQRRHIYNQFVIRAERRDQLRSYLADHRVSSAVYYPVSLHLQECFSYLGYRDGDFPASEAAARETLALPVYPELSDEQAAYTVETIARFYSLSPDK